MNLRTLLSAKWVAVVFVGMVWGQVSGSQPPPIPTGGPKPPPMTGGPGGPPPPPNLSVKKKTPIPKPSSSTPSAAPTEGDRPKPKPQLPQAGGVGDIASGAAAHGNKLKKAELQAIIALGPAGYVSAVENLDQSSLGQYASLCDDPVLKKVIEDGLIAVELNNLKKDAANRYYSVQMVVEQSKATDDKASIKWFASKAKEFAGNAKGFADEAKKFSDSHPGDDFRKNAADAADNQAIASATAAEQAEKIYSDAKNCLLTAKRFNDAVEGATTLADAQEACNGVTAEFSRGRGFQINAKDAKGTAQQAQNAAKKQRDFAEKGEVASKRDEKKEPGLTADEEKDAGQLLINLKNENVLLTNAPLPGLRNILKLVVINRPNNKEWKQKIIDEVARRDASKTPPSASPQGLSPLQQKLYDLRTKLTELQKSLTKLQRSLVTLKRKL